MSDFMKFKKAVQAQFDKMAKQDLFKTDIDRELMWETYLQSFPNRSNPLFRERTEHDCQCCRQFIKSCGNVVGLIDNEKVSIWDIGIGGAYQVVADALSTAVKAAPINDLLIHDTKQLGTDFNHQLLENGETIKWEHFHQILPERFVKSKLSIGTLLGKARTNQQVCKRGLTEITTDAAEIVLELIEQNSLYRGAEHKSTVKAFLQLKEGFNLIPDEDLKHNYCWLNRSLTTRNTVIGTLMTDIASGVALDDAVKMFESKVAPTNYKRSSAVLTKGMIQKAQQKIEELGISDAQPRRYATIKDITINNILFADRTAKKVLGVSDVSDVLDMMAKAVPVKHPDLKKVEEVSIATFIKDILPKTGTLEVMFENKHSNRLMSLIAPVHEDARSILKWNNNFSWSYNGEVTDAIKERVKKAGGNVDGVLRFSIQWNDGEYDQNDLDAHAKEPDGNLIHYPKQGREQTSSGTLDVDIVHPTKGKPAVENIVWTDKSRMPKGDYCMMVHNFSHRGGRTGVTAQIEFNGQLFDYVYAQDIRNGDRIKIATVNWDGVEFKLDSHISSTKSSKEVWGVSTETFQKVSVVMKSPNHWDGEKTGNKHWFFILDDCKNSGTSRGLYNEFLSEELREHRKVFEVLGSKMKTPKSEDQLSGLGFSSTQRDQLICKVTGSFNRTIKINF